MRRSLLFPGIALAVCVQAGLVPHRADAEGTDRGQATHDVIPLSHSHVGSSPFVPPDEEDTQFVVDQGNGLDTGCTFRSGGPLRITLRVKRYVGAVNPDGTLQNPNALRGDHLISDTASLRFPAFDIDVNAQIPGIAPEHDRLFFNGHDLGLLSGDNNIWKLNEFRVPIEWVKFPAAGMPGQPPAAADNVLQINIDESNVTEEWCMAVDWVQLSFDAIAPIVLVHGINSDGSRTWSPQFTAFFTSLGMPWSNAIDLTSNGTVAGNATELRDQLTAAVRSFGARRVHLICHSKGGLDSRSYLRRFANPTQLKVVSLSTLSTPHHGTIIADITVAARARNADPRSNDPDINTIIEMDWLIARPWLPRDPGLRDLQTGTARVFNATTPAPVGVRVYTYGADADLNGNRMMEDAELNDLIPGLTPGRTALGNAMYRTLGNVASVSVTRRSNFWGLNTWTEIEIASTNPTFLESDLMVTTASARAPFGTYISTRDGNHSTMKTGALAAVVLTRIKTDFPVTANP